MYRTRFTPAILLLLLSLLAHVAHGAPAAATATVRSADKVQGDHINLLVAPNGGIAANAQPGKIAEAIEMPALIDFRSIVAAFSKPIQGKNLAVESGARPTARIDDLDSTAMEKNHPLSQTQALAQTQTLVQTQALAQTQTLAQAQTQTQAQAQAQTHVQPQQQQQSPGFQQITQQITQQIQSKGSTLPAKDAGPNTIVPGQQIKNKPVAQIQDIDPDAELAPHSQSSTMNVVSRSVTQVVIHSKEKTAFVVDEDNDSDSDAESSKSGTVERAKKVDKADKEDSTSSGPQLDRLGANDNGASSLLSGREWKLATALLLIASCIGA